MANFTLDDFIAFLQGRGAPDRVVYLMRKYPDVVEPALSKIHDRLVAKGMLTDGGARGGSAPNDLTETEAAALPFLRELDAALKAGGHDATMAKLRDLMARPDAREAFRNVQAA